MAKTKKASARRALAKKGRQHEAIEDEEVREDAGEEREEAPVEARRAPEASPAPAAAPTRSAPKWAGLLPGIIVVSLIAVAILVQLLMN